MTIPKNDVHKAFVEGALLAMKNMAGYELEVSHIEVGKGIHNYSVDLAGLIGVTAKDYRGTMVIGFPMPVYLNIMEQMLGEPQPTLQPGLEDGAAEFANIIFGQAKQVLNAAGHNLQMALPSVMKGKDLSMRANKSAETTVFVLKIPAGDLYLEIAIEKYPPDLTVVEKTDHSGKVPKLDASVLMAFVEGVKKALKTQANIEVEIQKPFQKGPDTKVFFQIASVVGVTASEFQGAFMIAFEKGAFLTVMSKMLGEDYKEITVEIEDGASEMTNIVFGLAKQVLNQNGHAIQMAIPSLVRGSPAESFSSSKRAPIILPLLVDGGTIWIEFAFDDRKN